MPKYRIVYTAEITVQAPDETAATDHVAAVLKAPTIVTVEKVKD